MKHTICFIFLCAIGYIGGWWVGGLDRDNSTQTRRLKYAVEHMQERQDQMDNRLKRLEIPLPIIIEGTP